MSTQRESQGNAEIGVNRSLRQEPSLTLELVTLFPFLLNGTACFGGALGSTKHATQDGYNFKEALRHSPPCPPKASCHNKSSTLYIEVCVFFGTTMSTSTRKAESKHIAWYPELKFATRLHERAP